MRCIGLEAHSLSGSSADHPHSASPHCYESLVPTSREHILLAKENTWALWKKNIKLEWSVHSGIIGYLTPVSPGWDIATKSMSVFKESVWEHSEASRSLPQINAVVCLLIQPVKKWVMDFWIWSVSKLFIFQVLLPFGHSDYIFFNDPAHVIFAYRACSCLQALKLTSIHC